MTRVRSEVENRFGAVHGIVHAAGISRGSTISGLSAELLDSVLRAKVDGTLVLSRVFGRNAGDFVMLCSSLAPVLGTSGQAAHCAANAFSDVVPYSDLLPVPAVQVINWDTWSESGANGISDVEGAEVFARVLASGYPRLVISTRSIQARAVRSLSDARASKSPLNLPQAPEPQAAPSIGGFDRKREIEEALCAIWSEALQIPSVQPDDNVFRLGDVLFLALQVFQ